MSKITQNGEQLEIIIPSMHQDISSVLRIGSTFQLGQQVTPRDSEGFSFSRKKIWATDWLRIYLHPNGCEFIF